MYSSSCLLLIKSALFFLCVFSTGLTLAQSNFKAGYIITNEQDTLSGMVDYREGFKAYRTVNFVRRSGEQPVSYDSDQIKGYGFLNDSFFQARSTITDQPGENVFFEVIISGVLTLYRFENTFLVKKENEQLYELSNVSREIVVDGKRVVMNSNQHVGILNMLTSDCPELGKRVTRVRLSERDLADFVGRYNVCKNAAGINYKASKPWASASIGITAGSLLSTLEFQSEKFEHSHLTQGPFEKSTSPMAGISFSLTSPRVSERFSFLVDVLYTRTTYKEHNIVGTLTPFTNFVTIRIDQLKIPIGFRYTFPDRKYTPFVNLGISSNYHLKRNSEWHQEAKYGDIVYMTDKGGLSSMRKYQFGLWGGVGIMKSITKKVKLVGEVRYERTDGVIRGEWDLDQDLTSDTRNFQFVLGLRYN